MWAAPIRTPSWWMKICAVVADVKYPTSADIYDGILGAMRTVLEISGVDPQRDPAGDAGHDAVYQRHRGAKESGSHRYSAHRRAGDHRHPPDGGLGGGYPERSLWAAPSSAAALNMTAGSWPRWIPGPRKAFFEEMKAKGVQSIAISCVFSTVRNDHERRGGASSAARSWARTSIFPSPARSAPWA